MSKASTKQSPAKWAEPRPSRARPARNEVGLHGMSYARTKQNSAKWAEPTEILPDLNNVWYEQMGTGPIGVKITFLDNIEEVGSIFYIFFWL